MEQPTFQQSHHTELITANLSAAISDHRSDKTSSCSVFSSHLLFNKVRTASSLRLASISVFIWWGTGTSSVCAEHPSAPRADGSTPVQQPCHGKGEKPAPLAPELLARAAEPMRLGSTPSSAHSIRKASAAHGEVTNRQDKWQGDTGTGFEGGTAGARNGTRQN